MSNASVAHGNKPNFNSILDLKVCQIEKVVLYDPKGGFSCFNG